METKKIGISVVFILLAAFLLAQSSTIAFAVNATTAYDSYIGANDRIIEMQRNGYPTMPLLDMLSKAEGYYNIEDYTSSQEITENIFIESEHIVELKKDLDRLTDETDILKDFKQDTSEISISLLFAKSDYDAANIAESEKGIKNLQTTTLKILRNLSDTHHNILEDYKNNLSKSNDAPQWFLEYYNQERDFYSKRDHYSFLELFKDFENIRMIITNNKNYIENKKSLDEKNISFKLSYDMLLLFETQINDKEYKNALETLSRVNHLAKTALEVSEEIKSVDAEFEKFEELGILDNETQELYALALQEYSVENFETAKQKIDETKDALRETETQNIILGGINKATLKKGIKDFFVKNWIYMLILALIITATYRPAKMYVLLIYSKNALQKCTHEKEVIGTLQKELQKSYYEEKIIDKNSYTADYNGYEERKVDLSNRITMLEENMAGYNEYLEKIKTKLPDSAKLKIFNKKEENEDESAKIQDAVQKQQAEPKKPDEEKSI